MTYVLLSGVFCCVLAFVGSLAKNAETSLWHRELLSSKRKFPIQLQREKNSEPSFKWPSRYLEVTVVFSDEVQGPAQLFLLGEQRAWIVPSGLPESLFDVGASFFLKMGRKNVRIGVGTVTNEAFR